MSVATMKNVHMTPYVAAAIVEHGKRRTVAAGFILGEITADAIHITDYFPLTHVEALADVRTQAYKDLVNENKRTKGLFTMAKVVGWYSAGNTPSEVSPEQFKYWCEMPGVRFTGGSAIHVHCELPSQEKLRVSWVAEYVKCAKKEGTRQRFDFEVISEKTLPVTVSAMEDIPSNVFLEHVAMQALYGGMKPYATSDLLNLDSIAYRAAKLPMPRQQQQQQQQPFQPGKEEPMPPRPLEEALISAHDKLTAAVKSATGKPGSTPAADQKVLEEVRANLEVIRKTKEAEQEQQHNATSREDLSTQRFKDALMIKCMALMLRRDVRQIEYLAQDNANRGGKNREGQNVNANANNNMVNRNVRSG